MHVPGCVLMKDPAAAASTAASAQLQAHALCCPQVGDQGAIDSKRGEVDSLLDDVPDLPAGGKVREEITVSNDKQVRGGP